MERVIQMRRAPSLPGATRFLLIGALIYLALLAGAEWLVWRNGHANPILKVEQAEGDYDWVILGTSHAMPLGYDDFIAEMEKATGQRVINLAGPGTGPLYSRFTLERFLDRHSVRNVLYVVDAFAFRAPEWNEERLGDPKLLARTPFRPALVASLARHVWEDGVDPRAWLDYVSGFSKLNDRDRFRRDVFEGEAQFDRVFRPSASADRKRIDYLYPPTDDEAARQERYLADLEAMVVSARRAGAQMVLARFPVPARFAALMPDESAFDARLAALVEANGLELHDFRDAVEGDEFYADTDHLNRAGVRALLERRLRAVLTQ